ncbi:MAG: Rne/Rng family ribonuclease [Bradyrhizobiaceae bacterium]|nr:Rne/Rng family ribonuclease [Bradyrhizobiaceae bacterium]
MVRRILINVTPTHQRIAITEDGRLAELFTQTPDSEHHVGNIYFGRVSKILQGMNAAFIDIGLDQDAFLHFSDVDSSLEEDHDDDGDDDEPTPTVSTVESSDVALRTAKAVPQKRLPTFSTKRSGEVTINLQPKQHVIVQVTREAYHQKGVRVTTKVGLTGRNVVLLPFDSSIGVSRKIQSGRERKRLRMSAREVLPESMGCIIRTAAAGLDPADVQHEFTSLLESWRDIEAEVRKSKEPRLLHEEAGIAHGVIRDLFKDDVAQVVVDDRKVYRDVKAYVERTAPHLRGKIELYTDNRPLFDTFSIEREVHQTHQRRVFLPSGGSIVIDHTEAMVVIDVNSGRASNEKTQENNAVKTNFEAAREIAKQLRLRDIGGMVMVDFIDMQVEENRRKLFNELRNEVARDRAKTVVYPLTQLGIMQLTRQRIRQSMAERTSDDCPLCFGTGKVQNPATTMSSIDRWLRNFRARTWKLRVTIKAHPYTVQYLQRNRSQSLLRWLRSYFLIVKLQGDDDMEAGQFIGLLPSGKDVTKEYI